MNDNLPEEALIARLRNLSPAERRSCLAQACAEDPRLPDRLLAINTSFASASGTPTRGVSEDLAMRALSFALHSKNEETPGAQIGQYRLLEKIGEGGFGVVWLAEQQAPIRRRVAVKVIKLGMDTEEVITRFEAERQALALMDHPNIARVFDAGATESGRPYFVMELVGGVAITRYCDENQLQIEARLRVFISVCQAVQHAHQKGVIHRDLKPSNILVTLHDGVPVPKIIDFGISKATSGSLTEKTLYTGSHAFIGTPAYTSPEQLPMSGLDVDTRSDIYSLGVLLYELLAGIPPFDSEELQKSGLDAMRHTICEVDPIRPSRRIGTYPEELRRNVSSRRGTDALKLSLLLRGDLDCIAMHCLEKDRRRRYETANSLAADVRNYLSNEAVSARPASAAYRIRKFVKRNRIAVAAATTVALALLAGLVVASVSLVRERAAARREAALRREADIHAAKSAEVARFMKDMLRGVGPSVALGRDTAMLHEILDATRRRLDTELRNEPEVATDLREALGGVYCDLGQYATAEALLRKAVAMRRTVSGNDSLDTAASLQALGIALRLQNKAGEAATTLQAALGIRRKLLGPGDPAVADTLYELALVSAPERSPSERRAMMQEALEIRRRAFGNEHPAVAQAIAGLGYLAQEELDHVTGARLHAEALAMRRRLLGNEHPDVAASLDALGFSYAHDLDRKSEAAAAYLEAFTIRRRVLGDLHPKIVVSLLRFTGQEPARDVDTATLEVVRGFVANQRKGLPQGSPLLAPSLLALASLEDSAGRQPEEAGALVREAHAILEDSRANGTLVDPEIVDAMWLFAWSKFIANAPAEGLAMGEESLNLAQAAQMAGPGSVFFADHTLAWIDLAFGRYRAAAERLEAVRALSGRVLGEHHLISRLDLAFLADCYAETNRLAEAHRILETALHESDAGSGERRGGQGVALLRGAFGRTLLREGRFAEAEAVLRQTLAEYDAGEVQPLNLRMAPRQRVASGLGQALAGEGRFSEAEPMLVGAFQELQRDEPRLAGDRWRMVREALDAVVALYDAWGKPEKAAEWSARRVAALKGAP